MGEPKLDLGIQDQVSIRVNHLRFINNMQQKELALRLGMGASTLNNKIHGAGRWGLEDSITLCSVFEVSIDYLVGKEPLESAVPVKQKSPAASATGDSVVRPKGFEPLTF